MNWRRLHRLLFALFTLLSVSSHAGVPVQIPTELRACGDLNEWPPFSYFARDGKQRTETVTGYNVDYLKGILGPGGRHVTVSLMPWKRCLALAAVGQMDLVLDAAKTPTRERDLVFPASHYSVTPMAIFSTARPAPTLVDVGDLRRLNYCQILGWDYSTAGLPPAAEGNHPATLEAASAMLQAGRCDAVLYDLEIARGMKAVYGWDVLDGDKFSYQVLRWLPTIELFIAVSRSVPYRDDLVKLLNRGIAQMKKSGETGRLEQRYQLR